MKKNIPMNTKTKTFIWNQFLKLCATGAYKLEQEIAKMLKDSKVRNTKKHRENYLECQAPK